MDYTLNDSDRLQLQQMIKANDVEDQTGLIRTTKHSQQIREEVKKLHELKKEHADLAKTDPTELDNICISNCSFLFERYTDIYNRVFKDELDLNILDKFIDALKDIEDGNADQHEASVKVGKYLKELYIDSALKKTEKNDLKAAEENDTKVVEPMEVSWAEYKAKMVQPLIVRLVRKS
jgi:hypothetical protein